VNNGGVPFGHDLKSSPKAILLLFIIRYSLFTILSKNPPKRRFGGFFYSDIQHQRDFRIESRALRACHKPAGRRREIVIMILADDLDLDGFNARGADAAVLNIMVSAIKPPASFLKSLFMIGFSFVGSIYRFIDSVLIMNCRIL